MKGIWVLLLAIVGALGVWMYSKRAKPTETTVSNAQTPINTSIVDTDGTDLIAQVQPYIGVVAPTASIQPKESNTPTQSEITTFVEHFPVQTQQVINALPIEEQAAMVVDWAAASRADQAQQAWLRENRPEAYPDDYVFDPIAMYGEFYDPSITAKDYTPPPAPLPYYKVYAAGLVTQDTTQEELDALARTFI